MVTPVPYSNSDEAGQDTLTILQNLIESKTRKSPY